MGPYMNNPYMAPNYNYLNNSPNYFNNVNNKYQVVKVNGKNGAEAFNLPPNSSILLLDETAPIVWLKTTDGAGYASVIPYDIVPHQELKLVDTKELEKRIIKLEEMVNEFKQSNVKTVEQPTTVKRVVNQPK